MLHNLPNLRILFLDGNELSAFWIPAIGNAFFKYNKKLVYISMATARIAQLSVEMFWELPQLGKLFLYDNAISFLDPRLFEKSLQLRKLDLRNNRITVISENTFPRQILSNVVMLELGENPYECDCGLIWFSDWMNRTSIHLGQLSHYKCLTPPEQHGKHLIKFRMPPELCQSKAANLAFKLSISLSVSCSVILAVAGVVYKFRWHIGYLCFLLQSKRRKYRAIHDPTDYRYDAFIAYNRADAQWLLNNLVPKLEVECGLKLCIHDRDWPLGLDIYDNIVESISNSRKTILLVSNAFATSEWCHFEMTMAQSRLFEEDRNALIMVVLEDIQPTNITPRLAMQMKRQTFVVWTDNEMGKKLFWKKLHKAVKRPVDSVMFDPN
jgi:Leucine-rich repeat (LRR) protein